MSETKTARLPNKVDVLQGYLMAILRDHPNDEQDFQIVTDAIQKLDALIAEKDHHHIHLPEG